MKRAFLYYDIVNAHQDSVFVELKESFAEVQGRYRVPETQGDVGRAGRNNSINTILLLITCVLSLLCLKLQDFADFLYRKISRVALLKGIGLKDALLI